MEERTWPQYCEQYPKKKVYDRKKEGKKYYKFGKADKSQIDTYHLFNLKLAKCLLY